MDVRYNPDEMPYYDNVDAFLAEDDLLELDVSIVGYKGKFRIRALNFQQMEFINRAAKLPDGTDDSTEFALATIQQGVIRPKFNTVNARKLLEKNGAAVRELVDTIWALGRITKDAFDSYMATRTVEPDSPGEDT